MAAYTEYAAFFIKKNCTTPYEKYINNQIRSISLLEYHYLDSRMISNFRTLRRDIKDETTVIDNYYLFKSEYLSDACHINPTRIHIGV